MTLSTVTNIKITLGKFFGKSVPPNITPTLPSFNDGECKCEQIELDFSSDSEPNLEPFIEFKINLAKAADKGGLFEDNN